MAAGLGPRIIASDTELAATRDAIDAYFAGEDERLALPVDFSLVRSPFRRAALEELRTVGPGSVITYGGLAARIGHPRAARAIGTACARNPIPIVVPCHRCCRARAGSGAPAAGRSASACCSPTRARSPPSAR